MKALLLGMVFSAYVSAWGTGEFEAELRIKQLVYRAEVYAEHEGSLKALTQLLIELDDQQATVAEALAWVKRSAHLSIGNYPPINIDMDDLRRPQAIGFKDGIGFFLPRHHGQWLELGDWVGHAYIASITQSDVTLCDQTGKHITYPYLNLDRFPSQLPQSGSLWVDEVEIVTLLRLPTISGMNSFVPSNFSCTISGQFSFPDWLSMLDQVCLECGLGWSKRQNNIIIEVNRNNKNETLKRAKLVYRTNQNLGGLLHQIAEELDYELLLDEGLGDTEVDVFVQDQPWNEVIDCLAVMNHFQWWIIQDPQHKAKLIIQRE